MCATACLREQDVKMLANCIQLNRECAAICWTASQFMSMDSGYAKKVCGTCAEICEACAVECEKHAGHMEHCKKCAQACRKCAEECRRMAR